MTRRVVITGLGVVCPVGNTAKDSFENLCCGKSGIAVIDEWKNNTWAGEHLGVFFGGEVKNFNPEDFMDPKDVKKFGRFIHLAIAASQEAWAMSGLSKKLSNEEGNNAGAIIGVGMIGMDIFTKNHEALLQKGPRRISPFFIPGTISNLASGYIAIEKNLRGDNFVVVSACASGSHAIGEAYLKIKYGRANIMLAGGAESAMHPIAISGFNNMKALSNFEGDPKEASRPFDLHRDGFVMGEGAGIVVLEDLESAQNRGAHIIAEVVGYGSSCDANHITSPAPFGEGAQRAMAMAIKDAGIALHEVDYINAHGTSTPLNDKLETLAIKEVFKEHAKNLAISSTKSMTGHLLGAAGGVEAIFTALSIQKSIIPPTINLKTPDPECDLDYVPNFARKKQITYALSNSFGFGGANAVLALKKYS